MKTKNILGQPSWTLRASHVEAAITQLAGHLAPVKFRLGNRWVQPYDIAPWTQENVDTIPLLKVMRGDFFCMPFGGNDTPWKNEKYPPHGETANAKWEFEYAVANEIHLSLRSTIRKGRVDKILKLIPGHTAVYLQHVLSGMKGPMSFGHHPILLLPGQGTGRVSTSPFRFGQVAPEEFEQPVSGGYCILKTGAKFTDLKNVPRKDGGKADLTVYPAREGYEDLVLLASDTKLPFAWTALTVPESGYVWFSLKDPNVLPSTVFWMSNGGRHYSPWSSRHRNAIGLEEVLSYFHYGLAESAKKNSLNSAGVPTCAQLDPRQPLAVNYIMAMAAIPKGFDIVKDIKAAKDGKSVTLVSKSGKSVSTKINLSFLVSAPLS